MVKFKAESEAEEKDKEAVISKEDSDQDAIVVDPVEPDPSLVTLDNDKIDQLAFLPPKEPPLPRKWTAKRKGKKVSSAPIVVDKDNKEPSL
ncbi:hypothetical protein H1R20_g15039, partial [Candolleomyces eurysporus]